MDVFLVVFVFVIMFILSSLRICSNCIDNGFISNRICHNCKHNKHVYYKRSYTNIIKVTVVLVLLISIKLLFKGKV
jgi:DnaJ-class molecular chaperone